MKKTYELKNPLLCKHFIINAIEDFSNKLTLENKKFRVDFDEYTYKYLIRLDQDYFKTQGCISNDEITYTCTYFILSTYTYFIF